MLWQLLIIVLAVFLIRQYQRKRRMLKGLDHVPVIQYDIPFVGAGFRFLFSNNEQIMNAFIKIGGEYTNEPSLFWLGSLMTISISNPDDMKAVLMSQNCLAKPYMYAFTDVIGLFNAPVHIWKKDRRVINPLFSNNVVKLFMPTFNEKTEILVKSLKKHINEKRPFNISIYVNACTLDMVCGTIIGTEQQVNENDDQKTEDFVRKLYQLSVYQANRIVKLWLHFNWIYSFTAAGRHEKAIINDLRSFVADIREKQQLQEVNPENPHIDGDKEDRAPKSFVKEFLALNAQGMLDLQTLDDQLLVMILGANETTAVTTANVLLLLAMFPDIQERCYAELRHVVADQPPTVELIAQLDYLEMCISETMRLLPVFPFVARTCTGPTQLSTCTAPTGCNILLSIYTMHREPSLWGSNANDFDPERFRPEAAAQRPRFAYVPFSAGPRNCIGVRYAWQAMKVMLAAMLLKYEFRTELRYGELRLDWDVLMRIRNRNMVFVVERKMKQ